MMQKKISFLALLSPFFLVLASVASMGKEAHANSYTAKKINENLYVLYGSRGHGPNVGLSIAATRALIIDGPRRNAGQRDLVRAIRDITSLPIEYAVIPDGDYVLRERSHFFDQLGAKVISQENSQFGYTPSHIRFKNKLSLTLTDEKIDIHHITVNAHDDVIIHFPDSNTIFVGNLYHAEGLPAFFIGGLEGMRSAIDLLDDLSDEQTIIVPRYGNTTTIQAIETYLAYSEELVGQLHTLYSASETTDNIITNSQFLDVVTKFTGQSLPPAQRLSRLVDRIVSTEFVKGLHIPNSELIPYLGKYRSDDEKDIELIIENGKMFARQEDGFLVELIPLSEDEFHVRGGLEDRLKVSYQPPSKQIIGFELSLYGQTIKAYKAR